MPFQEVENVFLAAPELVNWMQEDIAASEKFRFDYTTTMKPAVEAEDMPFEFCKQGIIKHVLHENHNSREMCLNIYQQIIPGGSWSGQHRHMAEELFYVLEGKGYDLHYNTNLHCDKQYVFEWEEDPIKYEWEEGDFVYIPPYVVHQHYNSDPEKPVRLLSANNRLVKAMGMAWIDQLAPCPEWPHFTGIKDKILDQIHQL
jgi:quercetin dioxygenase-like cupin family protein